MSLYAHVHKLWIFAALAEQRNFHRAATATGVTQSAVSQSLAGLERALGVRLVERGRDEFTLTADGAELLRQVRPILASIAELSAQRELPPKQTTVLRLGAYESVALSFLAGVLARVSAKHPDVCVDLTTGRSNILSRRLSEGSLDVAVLDARPEGDLDGYPVAEDRLGLYCARHRATSSWRTAKEITLGTLAPPPRGYAPFFTAFHEEQRDKFASSSCDLVTRHVSDSFEVLSAMAARGDIAAVLPAHVAKRSGGALREITETSERAPPLRRGWHALWVVNRPRLVDEGVRSTLVSEIRAAVASLASQPQEG